MGWSKGRVDSRALLNLAAGESLEKRAVTASLVQLAQRHGLIGILAAHSDDRLVRAVFARESARRVVLESHLNRVLTRLSEKGVQTAVVKGPSIAQRYQVPTQRTFSDIDLLVPEHQLEEALQVLASDRAVARVPPKRPKADKRDILFEDASGVLFNVDLHWDLFSYSQLRGSAEGAMDAAWEEATEAPDLALGPAWELPDSYRIAFLAAHAVLDHRFRLILFRDLFELTRGEVDWVGLERVATRWGLRSTTFLAWWITNAALGAPVPPEFLESVRLKSAALSYLELALPRSDIVHFDGHTAHPVNLATVLLNDSRAHRLSLLLRAPLALPAWRRRVTAEVSQGDSPRTLIVVSTDHRRGAEVFTERLRDGLIQRGWVVEAVALQGTDTGSRADVEALVGESAANTRFDSTVLTALRNKIKTFRPDLIVANGGATLRYSLAARFGRRIALSYISIGEPRYWIRSWASKLANRLMLGRLDQVLTVSEETRRQTLELAPALKGRVHTVFSGVPAEFLRVPLRSSDGPLRILMIGSLTPEKNPQRALRVIGSLDNVIFRLVGDGPLREELEEQAVQLVGPVEFVGSVSDVTPHLAWAHVLLLTSRSEGLPGAILEAGAAGVPTVAVDVGGVREAVLDGETGFITEQLDGPLIQALQKLESDRELLSSMGAAARRHIESKFVLDHVIDEYARRFREASQ